MPSRLDISDGPKLLHIDAKAKPTPTSKDATIIANVVVVELKLCKVDVNLAPII